MVLYPWFLLFLALVHNILESALKLTQVVLRLRECLLRLPQLLPAVLHKHRDSVNMCPTQQQPQPQHNNNTTTHNNKQHTEAILAQVLLFADSTT